MKGSLKTGLALLIALTTAISAIGVGSEEDFTLEIFGNANMDNTIDEKDRTYVEGVINGTNAATNLSDANYDGKIDDKDIDQIDKIIHGEDNEITLIDSMDRIVTVKKPVKRAVILNYEPIEMFRTLNATDVVVGVSSDIVKRQKFFPEFSSEYDVGTRLAPDFEKIISINTDLVLLYATTSETENAEIEKKLKDLNPTLTVVRFDCFLPSTYIDEVTKLGYILNKQDEASEFVDFYKRIMDTIKDGVNDIPEGEKPRVYFELGQPYFACGKETTWHERVELAGGHNILGNFSGYINAEPEGVITLNPEVILKLALPNQGGGYESDDISKMSSIRDEITTRSGLANVTAVKTGGVYVISFDILCGGYCVGLAYVARLTHPDLFKDLDPQAIHQEYLDRFQRIDYDIKKHGIFVYPLPS